MNVKVETDTLKNGSKKIESYFTEHDELFNKINSLSTEYCTSLANFKDSSFNMLFKVPFGVSNFTFTIP